jgi:hypothetical protein
VKQRAALRIVNSGRIGGIGTDDTDGDTGILGGKFGQLADGPADDIGRAVVLTSCGRQLRIVNIPADIAGITGGTTKGGVFQARCIV